MLEKRQIAAWGVFFVTLYMPWLCYLETLDELEEWVTNIFQHIQGKWVVFRLYSLPNVPHIHVFAHCLWLKNAVIKNWHFVKRFIITCNWWYTPCPNKKGRHQTHGNNFVKHYRFVKFLTGRFLKEICNKMVIKAPTTPYICCHTTLWKYLMPEIAMFTKWVKQSVMKDSKLLCEIQPFRNSR